MHDQAEMLRQRLNQETSTAKVCAIASGKGGVGKSNVTVNLAIALKQTGANVLLHDLDIGMANLDILMGVNARRNIVEMVEQQLSILEIIERGSGGIDYIAGGNGLNRLFELTDRQFTHFTEQLQLIQERYDYIFLDMGAGASKDSLKLITSADEILLVTTPEPTAITDAYGMLKFLHRQEPDTHISVIVNRVENNREGREIGTRIQQAAKQFLKKEIQLLGYLPEDPNVFKAVKVQTPYLLTYPDTSAAKAMKRLARAYESGAQMQLSEGKGFLHRLRNHFFRKQGPV
jgi:flagellar biosynthesis protein FlhG